MHPSQVFEAKADEALAIAIAPPFATISAWDGEALTCVQAPLIPVTAPDGALVGFEGHLARANRFARRLIDGRDVESVAVFAGPDAYVSPSSYASKALHGRVVPTWNYITAEAQGRLRLIDDATAARAILSRQTDVFERKNTPRWALDEAEADYLERLVRGIVGVRLELTALTATRKLSQDKAEADFAGVMSGLWAQDDEDARAIAAQMRELEQG